MLLSRWRRLKASGESGHLKVDEIDDEFEKLSITFLERRVLDVTATQSRASCLIILRECCCIIKIAAVGLLLTDLYVVLYDVNHDTESYAQELSRRLSQMVDDGSSNFKQLALDTLLDTHLSRLQVRFEQINKSVASLMSSTESKVSKETFSRIKTQKKRVTESLTSTESLLLCLDRALEAGSGEDFSLEKSMFYVYSVRVRSLLAQINLATENLSDAEDFATTTIDTQRNQILKFELLVSTFSFSMSIVAAVSGLLGMNLDNSNYLPAATNSFLITCIMLSFSAVLAILGCLWYFKRVNVF